MVLSGVLMVLLSRSGRVGSRRRTGPDADDGSGTAIAASGPVR